jgi:hypothetical protein
VINDQFIQPIKREICGLKKWGFSILGQAPGYLYKMAIVIAN